MTSRVREMLDRAGVAWQPVAHPPAFTAHDLAVQLGDREGAPAKVVAVFLDDRPALCVVPAYHRVDLHALAQVAAARRCTLVPETDFARLFPGCEVGAMPPFGPMWSMPVFVDERVLAADHVVFPAGSHAEAMRVATDDFLRVSQARRVKFPAEETARAVEPA